MTCASFSSDGIYLATGSGGGMVRVWDLDSRQELFRQPGHHKAVQMVVFTSDGLQVVSAGYDDVVQVWDARSGNCLQTLRGEKRGEKEAFARVMGTPPRPFWARIEGWETQIHSSRTDLATAWFPASPRRLRSPSSSRTWAGRRRQPSVPDHARRRRMTPDEGRRILNPRCFSRAGWV